MNQRLIEVVERPDGTLVITIAPRAAAVKPRRR